jgi:hypothetical protein
MDWLFSLPPVVYGVALVILAILVTVSSRRYQHCPHCRRVVPRARRGWLRCRSCGRQYHRSVWLRR